MTEEQWFAHPDRVSALAELLRNPVLLDALSVLKNLTVKPIPIPQPNTDLIQYYALYGIKKEGYNEALLNLQILSKPLPSKIEEKPKPWQTLPKKD